MASDPIFARILRAFPKSEMDHDGSPIVRFSFDDAKSDPMEIVIDQDGAIAIENLDNLADPVLSVENLHTLLRASRKAKSLLAKWFESDAGRAWAKSQGL